MIIKYYDGNVVDSTAPIIAHQVNFEGIMGAGVAKNIREKYPDIMKDYQEYRRRKKRITNRMLL